MKALHFLTPLLFASSYLWAVEPAPKLVPRPIPGMATPMLVETGPAPAVTTQHQVPLPLPTVNPDQARILYIHRRATLPAELTKNLPTTQQKTTSSNHLQLRQGAIKIIPKSEVANLVPPQE